MGKGIWPALAVALLLALAPSASAATTRYASPDGDDTTSNCTATDPSCSLRRAVETVAQPGDEVVVAPGLYSLTAQINVPAIDLHGTAGQPRPRVVSTTPYVFVFSKYDTDARLADLQLEAPGNVVDTTELLTGTALMERIVALAGPAASGNAIHLGGGWTLRDSVAQSRATGGVAVYTYFGTVHVTNVTAIAEDSAGTGLVSDGDVNGVCVPPYGVESHALNVIARGGQYDLMLDHRCSGVQTLTISHSNFRRAMVSANPEAHFDDAGGNQEGEPLFAAPASLDFHELAGSPTVDAGAASSALGSSDIDGQPRAQGSAPDIGADEFVPPVVEPPVDMHRPVASLLAVTPGRFRVAAARSARARRGARISYALDEKATVTFTVKRIVKRLFHGRKRTAYRPMRGSFRDSGEVGGNTLRFSGRLAGRKLRPGLYRLVALPVDAAGNTGNAVYVRFRIVR